MSAVAEEVIKPLKIDLGCGPNPREGFIGIDSIKFDKVDYVFNLGSDRWPFEDNSVEEAFCSHTLEHLTNHEGKWERTHFFNELYRVLKPGKGCLVVIPHWDSPRYYGDPTHREPFSEFALPYLDKTWRAANAPHADIQHNPHGYSCHFPGVQAVPASLNPGILNWNVERQQYAVHWFKDAVWDMAFTVIKPNE